MIWSYSYKGHKYLFVNVIAAYDYLGWALVSYLLYLVIALDKSYKKEVICDLFYYIILVEQFHDTVSLIGWGYDYNN